MVVLVTNQRGVARGLMSLADVMAVNDRLITLLGGMNAHIDALYVCPHGEGECACRKPLPGLLLSAAMDHSVIELSRSVMIGDSESDVAAGIAAGAATIRILHGSEATRAGAVAPDLASAVSIVLDEMIPASID